MHSLLISTILAAASAAANAAPPTTSFTYQGSLADGGSSVDGVRSLQFKLWDSVSAGSQVGPTLSTTTDVADGVFTESLDFGAGTYSINQALWLEIIVEGQSLGRTPMSSTPFSLNTRGIQVNEVGHVGFGGSANQFASMYITNNQSSLRLESTGSSFSFFGLTNPSATWYTGINNQGNGSGGQHFYIQEVGSGGDPSPYRVSIAKGTGYVGIGTVTPATMLDVDGAVTIRGGADIVEGFDSSCGTAFEPGTVLVIDPNNPGMLMCSEDAYDAKVAGVVSGANGIKPGIKLGQDGVMDGDIPVAMTGRVYVKCSTENGVIQPGDRLTTASLRGHAMKATDGDLSDGAVIGKAMTSMDEATGMVLVLVNLQ